MGEQVLLPAAQRSPLLAVRVVRCLLLRLPFLWQLLPLPLQAAPLLSAGNTNGMGSRR